MEKNENMEVKRIFDIIRSKKVWIVLGLAFFTLLGYLYSYHYVVPKYKSTATLLLIPSSTSESKAITNSDLTLNSGLISTYSKLATNSKVLKQVINNLELHMTQEELLKQMQVSIIKNTYIIEIAVMNTNPEMAMDIAQEISNVFLNEIKEIYNLDNIGVVDEAQLPEYPCNVNHIKDIVMFLIMGTFILFLYVLIVYLFDNTMTKEEDIENYVSLKSLGNIPIYADKKQEIISRGNAKSYIAECINTIRTNILYMNSVKDAKTVLVTSCTPREGKSWVSANIAVSFAETDKKVLLIDADMRKGRAHKIFNVTNTEGLSNYLYVMTGEIEKDIELGKEYIKETEIPNLHILTNGTIPPNPSELLGSSNMKELIDFLKTIYDIIIIDAPPCKLVTDSMVLSTITDSVVLVVNSENTKIKDLAEVKKSIQVVGGEIIGAILNKKKITGKMYAKSYYGNSKQKTQEEMSKKEMYSVSEVIEPVIVKLKKMKLNSSSKEDELIEQKQNPEEENKEQQSDNRLIQEQPESLEKIEGFINSKLEQVKLNYEEVQELLRGEIARVDCTEQIIQINEILTNLKDSYLELCNKIRIEDIEKEEFDNKKIIDFKTFKKQENKKKVYSLQEDISYRDLEKTAVCIIPIQKSGKSNSSIKSYETVMCSNQM